MRNGSGASYSTIASSSIPLTFIQTAKANREAYGELGLRIAALLAGISNVVQKAPTDRLPMIQGNIEDVIR
jgi:hypothetical protein